MDEIYRTERDGLLRYAISVCRNRAAAEDAVQESFLRLRRAGTVRNPRAWLFRVAHRLLIDGYRRESRVVRFDPQSTDRPADADPPDESYLKKQLARRIQDALGRLPDRQRACLTLREYGDLSYREIAAVLEISLDQVKVQIFRARRALSSQLEEIL